jgi:hypothetical protein
MANANGVAPVLDSPIAKTMVIATQDELLVKLAAGEVTAAYASQWLREHAAKTTPTSYPIIRRLRKNPGRVWMAFERGKGVLGSCSLEISAAKKMVAMAKRGELDVIVNAPMTIPLSGVEGE